MTMNNLEVMRNFLVIRNVLFAVTVPVTRFFEQIITRHKWRDFFGPVTVECYMKWGQGDSRQERSPGMLGVWETLCPGLIRRVAVNSNAQDKGRAVKEEAAA